MPTPTRLIGNDLYLQFVSIGSLNGPPATGTGSVVQVKCDTTSVVLNNEEDDVATFCDAAAGGARRFFFDITAVQSTDPDSLWTYIWDHAGAEVAFVYAPHGNDTPSATQPHFTGNVKIGPKPSIGGQAQIRGSWTFETRWEIVGEPVMEIS